jgi:arylsulfatase A-like enzyme
MKTLACALALAVLGQSTPPPPGPNIIVLLADDVGYGDLSCYGATKVKTPHLDRLAREGLRFTDGHAPAGTCTPSRYALLTGEYAWRKKGTNILPGDAALIIEPGRDTLPSVLQKAGYATGAVGKWHLGLSAGKPDWNVEIKPGPREIGFDRHFLIPATGDRVPCVYVEDGRVAGLDPADPIRVSYGTPVGDEPTGAKNPELLTTLKHSHGHDNTIVNGIGRIGFMSGGKSARWKDEDMADVLARKAVDFIEKNKDRRFFLYFATHDIHVPRVPHPRFKGTSGCGTRGDAIHQLDFQVGAVLEALDRLGLAKDTLVVFSSDNGPVIDDGYQDGAVKDLGDHRPAGPLKGGKYSDFEGGTRVPFLARWPARIQPGTSDALVCQVDFLASFAKLAGRTETGPDGVDTLAALLGESKTGREELVEQARNLSLRQGTWKLIPGKAPQLYQLADDLGETRNLAGAHPEKVAEMTARLEKIRAR